MQMMSKPPLCQSIVGAVLRKKIMTLESYQRHPQRINHVSWLHTEVATKKRPEEGPSPIKTGHVLETGTVAKGNQTKCPTPNPTSSTCDLAISNVNKMHHDEEDTTDKTSGYTINIRSKAEELMVTALELNQGYSKLEAIQRSTEDKLIILQQSMEPFSTRVASSSQDQELMV